MYHLQTPDKSHHFADGTRFDEIVNAYKFDKQLRALVMEYLERIEVALRAKMTNHYSAAHGFFWYANRTLFADKVVFATILNGIDEEFKALKELFLKSYKRKYTTESRPPSQMALETLLFGKLVCLFKALTTDDLKLQITEEFGLPPSILETWFIWLSNLRNVCAHHARLWNRTMSAERPIMPNRKKNKFSVDMPENTNTTMYGATALINRLLHAFNPANSFVQQVETLIRNYQVDATLMGFPPD